MKAHKQNTETIVCSHARRIKKNVFDNFTNYSNWRLIQNPVKDKAILPVGVGGVVYKKELLDLDFIMDANFKKLAPTTDDLWFRMASLLKDRNVFVDPTIQKKNKSIVHNKGLENINLKEAKKKGVIFKPINLLKMKVKDYIGINNTPNDIAWDKIVKYVKENYDREAII